MTVTTVQTAMISTAASTAPVERLSEGHVDLCHFDCPQARARHRNVTPGIGYWLPGPYFR